MCIRDSVPYFAAVPELYFTFGGVENRYRRAVKWKQIQWCWAIPILSSGPQKERHILAIESNQEIEMFGLPLSEAARRESRRWEGWSGSGPPPEAPEEQVEVFRELSNRWATDARHFFVRHERPRNA